jgi:hypothetical protein
MTEVDYDDSFLNFQFKLEHTLTLCDELPEDEAACAMRAFLLAHTPLDVQDMNEECPVMAAMFVRARRIAATEPNTAKA